MTEFVWNPALHATYCPQHYPPPEDGGGSSWLCCCPGDDLERKRGRTVSVSEAGGARAAMERLAVEDRAAEVRLYGEEHVARLEAEANRG